MAEPTTSGDHAAIVAQWQRAVATRSRRHYDVEVQEHAWNATTPRGILCIYVGNNSQIFSPSETVSATQIINRPTRPTPPR
eukprot:687734-Prymnesium_polylepis.1